MDVQRKTMIGIDFVNVMFAGYYTGKLVNGRGQNVNAVKTFFFKLKSLKDLFNPDHIVTVSDVGRERTFRRKLYRDYKANRKPKDDDIMAQLKMASRLCALAGYPNLDNELYEADDILGMMSKYANENGMDMIIVSSDQDMYQLLGGTTYIYSPRGRELIDEAWLYEKYRLAPDQWVDLKMLKGDPSDNIPGVEGVGEVTALKLMHQYGSLDGILRHMNQLKPSLRESIKKWMDFMPVSRELVTIVTDYNLIGFTDDAVKMNEPWRDELFNELDSLELPSLTNVFKYSLIPW